MQANGPIADVQTFAADSLCGTSTTLQGAWGNRRQRRWEGIISANEPIVGLAIQRSYNRWSWSKSVPRDDDSAADRPYRV